MKIFRKLVAAILSMLMLFCAGCRPAPDDDVPKNSDGSAAMPTIPPTAEPSKDITDIVFSDELPRVTPAANANIHFTMSTADSGFNIYAPAESDTGYAYSPSIIYNADGSMDAWFSWKGDSKDGVHEWDWISYKHSEDGGNTWTDMRVVLMPTPDSQDFYSCCDPGVIFFGGYYYLGYTSCINSFEQGRTNNVFVARSVNPEGPYEKWNGNGWGGDPMPIITYNEEVTKYGAGEVSFVELDGTLYIYYTWECAEGVWLMVSTADSTRENWPETVSGMQKCCARSTDQLDVVYVEDNGMFLALGVGKRMSDSSGIQIFESKDGITFTPGEFSSKGIAKYAHNVGVSKRSNGHIQLNDSIWIGYGFSTGRTDIWAQWATRMQKITLSAYEGDLNPSDAGDQGVLISDCFAKDEDLSKAIAIGALPRTVKMNVDDGTYTRFKLYWYNIRSSKTEITDYSEVTFYGYDASVISFDGKNIIPKSVGKTRVTAVWQGYQCVFNVYVYESGFNYAQYAPQVASLEPIQEHMTISRRATDGTLHVAQIYVIAHLQDDTWTLAAASLDSNKYNLQFESSDSSVVRVLSDGTLKAVKAGIAEITVSSGQYSCKITVTVTG